jgi:hypothetical protein
MARLRKNETSLNIGPTAASAAPARRTGTPRTRTTAKTVAASPQPAPQEPGAVSTVTAVSETAIIAYLPAHEEIAARAYTYWVERGYAEGSPEKDWLRAEAELRQHAVATA